MSVSCIEISVFLVSYFIYPILLLTPTKKPKQLILQQFPSFNINQTNLWIQMRDFLFTLFPLCYT